MATVIRFSRHGTKKRPFFRMVVQDQRAPRDGKFIENIGTFDPKKATTLKVDWDRYDYWLKTGATPSETVKARVHVAKKNKMEASPKGGTPEVPPPAKKETKSKSKQVSDK